MAKPDDPYHDMPGLLSESEDESTTDSESETDCSSEEEFVPKKCRSHACACKIDEGENGSAKENNDPKQPRSRKRKHVNKSRKHAKKKQKVAKRWRNTTIATKLQCVDRDEIYRLLKQKRCGCPNNCLQAMWECREVTIPAIYSYRQQRFAGTIVPFFPRHLDSIYHPGV